VSLEPSCLHVPLGERGYDILVAPDLLDRAGELLGGILRRPRLVLVTDENIARTAQLDRLSSSLARAGVAAETIVVPAGESSKSWPCLEELCEKVLASGIDRGATLVAFGGGVVGDLAGFAAAVLLRGIDLVQIPTTLLAQVDSSVGGKTGINSPHGKNLIGAFHQPRLVIVDPTLLRSLPRRELLAGYAELVKHALISDEELFAWLEAHLDGILAVDPPTLAEAIRRSVAVKVAIVGRDERETSGERALLNFGHTFAHAYEKLTRYGDALRHGEAVALGMARAYALSVRLGDCSGQDAVRACRHLSAAGLPTRPSDLDLRFPPASVIAAMQRDKKAENGRLVFVLSGGLGRAHRRADIPIEDVTAVLSDDA
jgi:3-dehydroquinate synthase